MSTCCIDSLGFVLRRLSFKFSIGNKAATSAAKHVIVTLPEREQHDKRASPQPPPPPQKKKPNSAPSKKNKAKSQPTTDNRGGLRPLKRRLQPRIGASELQDFARGVRAAEDLGGGSCRDTRGVEGGNGRRKRRGDGKKSNK